MPDALLFLGDDCPTCWALRDEFDLPDYPWLTVHVLVDTGRIGEEDVAAWALADFHDVVPVPALVILPDGKPIEGPEAVRKALQAFILPSVIEEGG